MGLASPTPSIFRPSGRTPSSNQTLDIGIFTYHKKPSDEIWKKAARHYNEAALGALVMSIGLINLWNRLNAATHQVGGEWTAQYP